MKSRLPKVLHDLCGRPMLGYVIEAARTATDTRPLVVVSPDPVTVQEAFAEVADFAVQTEPLGTADAVVAGLAALPADAAEALVVYGDVPLLEAGLLEALLDAHRTAGAALSLVSVVTIDPGLLGRLVRDDAGEVERIVEARDASEDELEIDEINAGIYAFEVAWLRRRIGDLRPSPATGELYLTELVALARADGRPIATVEVGDDGTLLGINDRAQLADATYRLRERINERHLLNGVTMLDPSTAWVDADVVLAPDVTLEPNVILRGRTTIGEGTTIGSGSQLIDTRVGRQRPRGVRGRGRRVDRAVRPPPSRVLDRHGRQAGQLRRGQEQPARGRRPAAPHELPRRCARRRPGQHRGGHDHGQLRRHAQEPDDDR
jgi:bifunctional UDP-N-acetylglucosamine pyrophosphorylase/glucosamine-1-phosphate N-acetyltransferase